MEKTRRGRRFLRYITYGALVAYSLYSTVLYFLSVRRDRSLPIRIAHRVDIACFLILVALSSGTSGIFFFFSFFAILVASALLTVRLVLFSLYERIKPEAQQ